VVAPYGKSSELSIDDVASIIADPYMTGNIPKWTAVRQQAVDKAVPKIIERLRPKYGRMYNFDDAQPFNVRLMAMDMQVTMSNR
jgi:hypothetical protein